MIFWIASYPKSGNTWLRALISSYYYSNDGIFNQDLLKKIDQFPTKKYFDEFDYNKKVATDTCKLWIKAQQKINVNIKELKFFKTHNIFGKINNYDFTDSQNSIGCLYVVRDPRNVFTSLKNHYDLNYEQSLDFMLNEKKYIYDIQEKNDYADFHFLSSWSNHYKSWINNNLFKKMIIKYEDLEHDTFKTLKNLIIYINTLNQTEDKVDEKKINNCIKTTNFKILKNKEKNEGFLENVYSKKSNKKIDFFNLGPKNKWRKIVPKKFHEKINNIFKEDLKNLKY